MELDEMEYSELLFRGRYMVKERKEANDNAMVCAAFTGWHVYVAQGYKKSFDAHLIDLGLKSKPKLSKEQLELEARIALANAKRVQERMLNSGQTGI